MRKTPKYEFAFIIVKCNMANRLEFMGVKYAF